jgi:putative hydrolase
VAPGAAYDAVVSLSGPGAGGNFLEQLLGDLLKMMGAGSSSGARIELARSLAHGVATGGEAEGNVDPVERIQLEELVRVAELHVTEITGLAATPAGTALEISAVRPGAWAWSTIEDWRFLLDAISDSGAPAISGQGPASGTGPPPGGPQPPVFGFAGGAAGMGADEGDDPGELLARWMSTLGPMLGAMQLGSAVGHLARTTMGQYELPIPRPSPSRLLIVPGAIDRFAEDWSLPPDEVRLWVCLREVTSHAVLSRPHVAARLRELFAAVVTGMAGDTTALVDRLGGMDPSDPESLQSLLADPEALMAQEPSPERARAEEQLMAVTVALSGYVEHILDLAASRLLGGRGALTEAWRRRQVAREPAERSAELMVGLDLGPAQIDRGVAFVDGVVSRAGEAELARLWERASNLPTPAEIEAPGLWLERISLPDGGGDPTG